MVEQAHYPTPYPEVNTILQILLSEIQAVLGEYFVGMYLHGSLAGGDFTPHRSDIDFLVVTTTELPPEMLPELAAMHARIAASGMKWAAKVEGSYIPRSAIRRYDPAHSMHPAMSVEGSFGVGEHGSDWIIQRYILREHGIVLAGPPLHTMIDPVTKEELRQASLDILEAWWRPKLTNSTWLQTAEYQAFAILTMCRTLDTVENAHLSSKTDAARWAQGALGEPWATLIERALAWTPETQWDLLDETLAFIRFTLERTQQSVRRGG